MILVINVRVVAYKLVCKRLTTTGCSHFWTIKGGWWLLMIWKWGHWIGTAVKIFDTRGSKLFCVIGADNHQLLLSEFGGIKTMSNIQFR